jgi:hypothetical protein
VGEVAPGRRSQVQYHRYCEVILHVIGWLYGGGSMTKVPRADTNGFNKHVGLM